MNYQAFTNASLTMMHHAIRGALVADDALSDLGVRVRETRSGKCTLLLSKLKWLGVECFSTSSIGRKIRRCCSLQDDA